MNKNEPCIEHYFSGMRVEVGIPMPDSKTFRDWAVIREISEDLLSLQLSRDILPVGLSLRVGQIITICFERDLQVHSSNAFILSRGYEQELLLRVGVGISGNELREFYRIDTFIPVKCQTLDDQDPANVKRLWETRQLQRQEDERARELRVLAAKREKLLSEETARLQRLYHSSILDLPADQPVEEPEENEYEASWTTEVATAVNISAGGFKIATDRQFEVEELILLEMFVPSSRCIVEVVARIVFSYQTDTDTSSQNRYYTGMQFVLIDESSRFAINNHISSIQLRQIRQFKGFSNNEPLTVKRDSAPDNEHGMTFKEITPDIGDKPVNYLYLLALLVCIIFPLYTFSARYIDSYPKNQIQTTFEKSISKLAK